LFPGATSIGQEDCQQLAGKNNANQEATEGFNLQYQAHNQRINTAMVAKGMSSFCAEAVEIPTTRA